jgi:hypothetical protein
MKNVNIKGRWNRIPGKEEQTFANLSDDDLSFRKGGNDIGLMKTTSIASLVVASVVLVVYFLLCGGELSAGIVLLGWILITRKSRGARWVFTKARSLAPPISRIRASRMSQGDLHHGSMRRAGQTRGRLVR